MNRPLTPVPSTEINKNTSPQQLQYILEEENSSTVLKNQLFVSMYITLKSKIKEDKINVTTIITILKTAMELIEITNELKGSEQKDFAVLLVKELITKSRLLSKEQKQNCLMVIDLGILDNVVDFVVDATNGNVAINKKNLMKKIKKLFSFCCKK